MSTSGFFAQEILFGLVTFVFPITVGIGQGKRLSRLANFGLMAAVWFVGNEILALITTGEFPRLASFADPVGILLLFLIFALVALKSSKQPTA